MFTFAHKGGQIIKQHTYNIMSCFIEKQNIESLILQRIYYPIIIKRSGHSERISKLQFIYDVILLFSYGSPCYLYLIFSYVMVQNRNVSLVMVDNRAFKNHVTKSYVSQGYPLVVRICYSKTWGASICVGAIPLAEITRIEK